MVGSVVALFLNLQGVRAPRAQSVIFGLDYVISLAFVRPVFAPSQLGQNNAVQRAPGNLLFAPTIKVEAGHQREDG